MSRFIDLTGKKFGHLTVIKLDDEKNRTYWLCECDCIHRNIISIRSDVLKSNKNVSCNSCNENTYIHTNNYIIGKTYNNNNQNTFIIDVDDFNTIKGYTWLTNESGYILTYIHNKIVFLHRYIMENHYNIQTKLIDHINHNTSDNRKENLRVCTPSQNQQNRKPTKDSISFKGVSKNKRDGKYRATLKIENKKIELGIYDELKYAIISRVQGEYTYFGDFRFKDEDIKIEKYCNMSIQEIINFNIEEKRNKLSSPVIQLDKSNNTIKEWENALIASKQLNCDSQHIYDCCNRKRKTHGGFKWKYVSI